MSGFYLNELLLKLTERCDPHPEIFDSYAVVRRGACAAAQSEEPSLRRFEKRLLDDLGYGLELSRTDEGRPVEADRILSVSPRSAVRSPASPRRRAPSTADPWPICEAEAFSDAAFACAMRSACCARRSMPVSTAGR